MMTFWRFILVWAVLGTGLPPLFSASAAEAAAVVPVAPTIGTIIPEPGSPLRELYAIEVFFDQPVQGVDAADLLVNGVPATNVFQLVPGQFLFTFPQPADGAVTVAWRVDHGITDSATGTLPFGGGNWGYGLDTTSPAPDVLISEFMADNRRTLNDEDGNSSDWIEIFNGGATQANLNGWFLTDASTNLTKWRFPEISLPPNSYLIVFASGKDRTNVAGRLHTNFKLATEGGYLALLTPATNLVSAFAPAYPAQFADVSYGRVPGAPHALGYFVSPTPGTPNSSSGPGFAPEVQFSRSGGPFFNPFNLSLGPVGGATNVLIRYTLDGSLPTNSSPVFVEPLGISNSVQVRARAFQEGLLPGPPHSESYLLLSSVLTNVASDLPILIIHTLNRGTPNSTRPTFAHLSLYEPVNGWTSLTNPPTFMTRAGVKIRGSSTEGLSKASYGVEFWDEFNQDHHLSLLGLPADSDWVLYAPNSFEPIMIHNPFVHQLSRDIGQYSPRTRFVEVYVSRVGPLGPPSYNGIYVLEEKIKIGKHRVDIDTLEPENLTPPTITGGYLLKIDRLDPGDSGLSAGGVSLAQVDPKERDLKTPQRRPQQNYLRDYFNAFNKALSGTNFTDPSLGYAPYLDVPAAIDYHIVETLSGNVDALVLSAYFHKPREGKITFGPHWDFDRALGSTDGRDANPRSWSTGPFFFAAWWNRLFADKDFWQQWLDRYQELRRDQLSLPHIHGLIDHLANQVRQAQPREYARWRVAPRGGSYQSEINVMKNWLSNRLDFIDKQITQPPRLSAPGGSVSAGFVLTIAGPTNATVYYTLDGSDPRAPQGALAPRAITYTAPILIDANVRIAARARDLTKKQVGGPPSGSFSPWSGPVTATFLVTPLPLLLTEIMYHPAPASVGSTNMPTDYEFLELLNAGTAPLSLAGFRFTSGVQFAFSPSSARTNLAPGERTLLVKNRAAFLARYPAATNIAGEFTGSLGNRGNRLTLVGPLQETVFDLLYADAWDPMADGHGFSLVVRAETTKPADLADPARWRLSAHLGGSPGLPDPPPPLRPRVYINEIVSNPPLGGEDAVELFCAEGQAADISGWWLTDNANEPKKYRLPPATLVPANGYLVLRAVDFHPSNTTGFGLSSLGDSIYLFSADATGELTGWRHGFAFGAQAQGTSFVRWIGSDGSDHLVPSVLPSLGRPNSDSQPGPVIFNEIMYSSPPTEEGSEPWAEFVELADIGLTEPPTALFDPAHPTNTWHIRGGVDFEFPPGFRMPPSRLVVVVGFDPQDDINALRNFRARYRLDGTVTVLGPWRGALNNGGEALRLLRPLPPILPPSPDAGTVPHVVVEEVHYFSTSPWPANLSTSGRSLSRRVPIILSDDPGAWQPAFPTPGDHDSDGDGLPDRWELGTGLDPHSAVGRDGGEGDPDGDGYTNLQEYLAGTRPLDAASYPHLTAWRDVDGMLHLGLETGPSRGATLLYSDRVPTSNWQVLRPILSDTQGGIIDVIESSTVPARYYRLRIP